MLQIIVNHRTWGNQNWPVSYKIPTVVRHDIQTFFNTESFYRKDETKNLPYSKLILLFGDVKPKFVSSAQDGVLVGNTVYPFKAKILHVVAALRLC